MSKGSTPRPKSVPREEFADRWSNTFGEPRALTPDMIDTMLEREQREADFEWDDSAPPIFNDPAHAPKPDDAFEVVQGIARTLWMRA